MNIFRALGDMFHLLSFFVLIYRLRRSKNATGISLKTQELYFLVFITRYLDLFTTYYSLYNSVMKIIYISASGWIVYMIRFTEPFKTTYDRSQDKFPHKYAVLACLLIALIFNEGHFSLSHLIDWVFEVCWAFSMYLEAVAIFPQLVILHKDKVVENLTSHYVASLGAYRTLYVINWVYRYMTEPHYRQWIAWVAGVVQSAFFADFAYFYVKSIGQANTPLPQ